MRVEFLGTSGFFPTERRHTSCVLIPEVGLALDAGTGIFRLPPRLGRQRLEILLTHAHLDHIVGLTFLLPHIVDGLLPSATVFAAPETVAAVREHLFAPALFPVPVPYEFIELTEPRDIAGGRLTFRPQSHPGGSVGYRIDWPGRSLAYLTDTPADDDAQAFIEGVDLLIHECTYPDGYEQIAQQTGHSTTTPVCVRARDAGVGRLVLTHFDPYLDLDDPVDILKARAIFPNVEVAYDGLVIDF